jgi:osmoprotectant transport system permease protein
MTETLFQNLEVLPGNLGNHLLISVVPLLLGLALSFPLAILAVRHPRLRYPTLTIVSVVQTVPSLALLALMVPVLVGLGWLTSRWLGFDVPALGLYPTLIALTLYSMLPMLRNMVTGILGVDPAVTEAARGTGMTPTQSLWKIEVPLALPVIIAGIRTATVWTVGIATLATPVGQRCLGNYIFRGLQTRDWMTVLFGCVVSALVAIFLDFMIGRLQDAAEQRRRVAAMVHGGVLFVVVGCGMAAPQLARWIRVGVHDAGPPSQVPAETPADESAPRLPVVIGSKTFTEQYILAELISDLLQREGLQTEVKQSLGSTVIFDGLTSNEVDCYVDYTGTIWANHMGRSGSPPSWEVLARVNGWLAEEHGVRAPGALGFENAYVLAMRRGHAEELGLETIADLAQHAPQLKIGSDYEFFGRPEWKALRRAYSLEFADRVVYDATFMYEAIDTEQVDVISAFSTDGRIRACDLKVLDDPQHAIPPYDALLLLSPRMADHRRVVEALAPLVGGIDLEAMRSANYRVDRQKNKQTIAAAADWLREQLNDRNASKQGSGEADEVKGASTDR